jgi:hypothetical protein
MVVETGLLEAGRIRKAMATSHQVALVRARCLFRPVAGSLHCRYKKSMSRIHGEQEKRGKVLQSRWTAVATNPNGRETISVRAEVRLRLR